MMNTNNDQLTDNTLDTHPKQRDLRTHEGEQDKAVADRLADLDKAINSDSGNADARFRRSLIHLHLGNNDKAVEDCTEAIKLASEYFLIRGAAYLNKGDCDQAIRDFTKAIELDPENGDAYSFRGVAYLRSGAEEKALDDHGRASEIDPEHDDLCGCTGFAPLRLRPLLDLE